MEITRRKFLGASAAAVIAAGTMGKGKVFGANDRIGVCVLGLNGRGRDHLRNYVEIDGCEIVAMADPDERILGVADRNVTNAQGRAANTYSDVRAALADEAVDVVSIASPNHWHTLSAIWACQAGKDVFIEKPLSHNVWEGRQLIAAEQEYGRVMVHGTQRRSSRRWLRDVALLQSGEIIGPIYMARGLCYKAGGRGDIGVHADAEVPKHLNWEEWQGPAARRNFNPVYHPYRWHWFWDYGNGEIGNQGVHQMDICSWVMQKGLPVRVFSSGGRYTYEDMGQTPNTQVATLEYADGTQTVFEVRGRWTNNEAGVSVGNLFYGSEGYYVEGQGFFNTRNEAIPIDDDAHPYPEVGGNHYANFLNAVRTRKKEDIYGDMSEGHICSAHCHLANVAYQLGRSLVIDPKTETILNDEEANRYLTREYAEGYEVPQLA